MNIIGPAFNYPLLITLLSMVITLMYKQHSSTINSDIFLRGGGIFEDVKGAL